jgi:capsular polysaccharide transport system ATP-binding protein
MIQVHNLTKYYTHNGKQTNVFRDLSFEIKSGQSVALLGRNGAGKSTLLRILGGILLADRGTIRSDCTISWPVGLRGGFVGTMTGRQNVTFVSKVYLGNDREQIEGKVRWVEEFAELGIYYDRPFNSYSSGMRSRLMFGMSMAFDFDVYLIDEVTSAGDERFRNKTSKLLQERHEKSDYIMVSHNLWGLEFHCERALLLHNGSLLEFDDLHEGIAMHKQLLKVHSKSPESTT